MNATLTRTQPAAALWCRFPDCVYHDHAARLLAATAPQADDATAAAIAGLTASGRKFMRAVGMQQFDFFDEGIVAGSGNWGENLSWQFAGIAELKPRSVSGVMSRLSSNGMWEVSKHDGEDSWWSLTDLGAAVAQRLAKENAL